MEPPQKFEKPFLLAVEGRDEREFFDALLKYLGLGGVQLWEVGGKSKFGTFLKSIRTTPGYDDQANHVRAIGIIRDADQDPHAAFSSLCSDLQAARLPIPSTAFGWAGQDLRIGIAILPDANTTGMLEDLCLASIQNDPALYCGDAYFECLSGSSPYEPPKNPVKARLLAYLASKPETDPRLGLATQKGYWSWGHPAFDEIKQFLLNLASS